MCGDGGGGETGKFSNFFFSWRSGEEQRKYSKLEKVNRATHRESLKDLGLTHLNRQNWQV